MIDYCFNIYVYIYLLPCRLMKELCLSLKTAVGKNMQAKNVKFFDDVFDFYGSDEVGCCNIYYYHTSIRYVIYTITIHLRYVCYG